MEAAKQFLKIPKNHEVKIKIPLSMPENEIVEVILILKKKQEKLFFTVQWLAEILPASLTSIFASKDCRIEIISGRLLSV